MNLNQKWNNDKRQYECKHSAKDALCKEDFVWNPSTYNCKIVGYLKYYASIKSKDSVIKCD